MLGLIGGIGCGKSTVARFFQKLGATILDADLIGHEVLKRPAIRKRLVQRWGKEILGANGFVDRAKTAARAFSNRSEAGFLNRTLHPPIEREIRRRLEKLSGIVILEAALLLEAGADSVCNALVLVDAPRSLRERRVRSREWLPMEARRRERFMIPIREKRRQADFMIKNDGSLKATRRQVRALFQILS